MDSRGANSLAMGWFESFWNKKLIYGPVSFHIWLLDGGEQVGQLREEKFIHIR